MFLKFSGRSPVVIRLDHKYHCPTQYQRLGKRSRGVVNKLQSRIAKDEHVLSGLGVLEWRMYQATSD
jgi:hypothetical protein